MIVRTVFKCLSITVLALSLSACLTRRTVTEGGQVVESNYVVKRPIKEAIDNSR